MTSGERKNTDETLSLQLDKEVFNHLSQEDEKKVGAILQRLDEKVIHEKETWLDIGYELNLLKPHVKRGKLATWVKREYGLEPRSAQQRMKAAKVFEQKLDVMSMLAPQTLIALCRDDAEAMRPTIVAMLEGGEDLSHDDVLEIVNGGAVAKKNVREQPDDAFTVAALILDDSRADYVEMLDKLERVNAKGLLNALIAQARNYVQKSQTKKKQPDDRTAVH